jgi:hypothetical protein
MAFHPPAAIAPPGKICRIDEADIAAWKRRRKRKSLIRNVARHWHFPCYTIAGPLPHPRPGSDGRTPSLSL